MGGCAIKSVKIPTSVKQIGECAFDGCHQLEAVELHEGLEFIGESAFAGTGIKSIKIPASVERIGGAWNYLRFPHDSRNKGASELNKIASKIIGANAILDGIR